MDIYVANGTNQNREFYYRVPGKETPRMEPIAPGCQAKLPGDFTGEALNSIIRQLQRNGAVEYNDLTAITKPHTLVYRVEKVVDPEIIHQAHEIDMGKRELVAAEQMENAGMAAYAIAQRAGPVIETTLEITEVNDVKTVDGGVNMEVTVSAKASKAGKLERKERPRRKR